MTSRLKRCYNELKRFRALDISKRLLLNSICNFGGKETLSAFPPPHFPSSNKFQKLSFFILSTKKKKKAIETTKKCDCDRKRLLKRLGCLKSLKTSQGRQVVKTLKYTFFPLVYKIEVEDAAHETHNMLLPVKFLVAFGSWGHLLYTHI